MNYHLEPLNKIEGRNYIQGRLNAAKATQSVFEESAFEAILNAAGAFLELSIRFVMLVC